MQLTRLLGISQSIPIFLITRTIACAESTKFLDIVMRYVRSSSRENPFWWMIFICFTIVDFPDSPEPVGNGRGQLAYVIARGGERTSGPLASSTVVDNGSEVPTTKTWLPRQMRTTKGWPPYKPYKRPSMGQCTPRDGDGTPLRSALASQA